MLVITRRRDEAVDILPGVRVRVLRIRGGEVRLGIEAPQEIRIARTELIESGGDNGNGSDSGQ